MKNCSYLFAFLALSLLVPAPLPGDEDQSSVDFSRDILPILSNKCFVCHGPDAKDADMLRLDAFETATADRGGYHAIDTQSPEKSEILRRIHSSDEPMPPEEAEKQLTDEERERISRWVRSGGRYAKHWAFVPPTKKQPVVRGEVPDNPIDAFVLSGIQEHSLDFAPSADRSTLARRAALVLTGLPPEPDLLAEFLADEGPDAYEQFVGRLLSSPRFGEHQARYWLDAVRYGDTHGLHLDNRRGIYPYRDWVVNAFNDNLPLDQFIVWQLSGDLLPNPTLSQQVATGYVRLNPSTGEGGAIPAEFQVKNNFDRVETLGTVFLGMSLTCARCHTHKYDPIPQQEYYRLLAFFNSTAEPALDGNSYTYGPHVKAPRDQSAWREWNRLEAQQRSALAGVADHVEQNRDSLIQHATATAGWKSHDWRISKPAAVSDNDALPETSPINGLPGTLAGRGARGKIPGANQLVWVTCRLEVPAQQVLWLTYTGGQGSNVILDGQPLEGVVNKKDRTQTILPLALSPGEHEVRLKVVGSPGQSSLEVDLHNPWQALADHKSWTNCDDFDRLLMLADASGPLAGFDEQTAAKELLNQVVQARADFTTSLVARDLPEVRPTRVLKRGEYDLPTGEPVDPGVLSVMGEFPTDAPRNRLGLAQWLTGRDHPLVARVLVNRIWQRVFGQGLVRSPEDFGLQGQQPTHPELLDWLAVELHESGWNLKQMLRLLVSSRTFRQNSAWRSEIDDPENRVLARGPSHRLDAEVLRDIALWASGLLDPQMGGEGVKPYQPAGMWLALAHPASNTKKYERDSGRLLYRRSLYVYWKRTSPHPMMTLFDAPDRESSCVRRSRTNTALQSLGLLNETQRMETARSLAERLLREADNDDARLDMLFRLLASRPPNEDERAVCHQLLETMRQRYADAPADAEKVLSPGEASRDTNLDLLQHAAWTQVAITILASDLAIMLY